MSWVEAVMVKDSIELSRGVMSWLKAVIAIPTLKVNADRLTDTVTYRWQCLPSLKKERKK